MCLWGPARDTLAVTSGLHVVSITHELISSLLTAVKTVTSLSDVCVIFCEQSEPIAVRHLQSIYAVGFDYTQSDVVSLLG